MTPDETGRNQDGTFAPGVSGNPNGRPKGARTKLSEDFCQALLDDFSENGADAIRLMRAERPGDYAKMIAGILSKEVDANISGDLSPEMKKWLGMS